MGRPKQRSDEAVMVVAVEDPLSDIYLLHPKP